MLPCLSCMQCYGGRSLLGIACTPICAVRPGLLQTSLMQDTDAALSELYAVLWREEPVGSNTISTAEPNTQSTSSCV